VAGAVAIAFWTTLGPRSKDSSAAAIGHGRWARAPVSNQSKWLEYSLFPLRGDPCRSRRLIEERGPAALDLAAAAGRRQSLRLDRPGIFPVCPTPTLGLTRWPANLARHVSNFTVRRVADARYFKFTWGVGPSFSADGRIGAGGLSLNRIGGRRNCGGLPPGGGFPAWARSKSRGTGYSPSIFPECSPALLVLSPPEIVTLWAAA